jgi:hypothetical protein
VRIEKEEKILTRKSFFLKWLNNLLRYDSKSRGIPKHEIEKIAIKRRHMIIENRRDAEVLEKKIFESRNGI